MQNENYFDKFVKDLVKRQQSRKEAHERGRQQEDNWPRRELQQKYREHLHNKIRYENE